MKTFYLITNSSGCTYWSYKVGREHAAYLPPAQASAVMKHGTIYVNRNGGWMPEACVITIHRGVKQMDFPAESVTA